MSTPPRIACERDLAWDGTGPLPDETRCGCTGRCEADRQRPERIRHDWKPRVWFRDTLDPGRRTR